MRLIDADAMLKRLEEWNTHDKMDKALYNFTKKRIVEQPTVNEWIPVKYHEITEEEREREEYPTKHKVEFYFEKFKENE